MGLADVKKKTAKAAKPKTFAEGNQRDQQELWCENGNHKWYRDPKRGKKPRNCPDHLDAGATQARPEPKAKNDSSNPFAKKSKKADKIKPKGGLAAIRAKSKIEETEPEKKARKRNEKPLESLLINRHFAKCLCPVHPDDPDHVMELKSVSHNDNYGPSQYIGGGKWRQMGKGETVMHQCLNCKAVTTYTTTAQVQFSRQNEPRDGKHCNRFLYFLGLREDEG